MKSNLARIATAILLVTAASTSATAGSISPVVPVGGGKFMITGRNTTVFGSADGIAANLMIKANQYCSEKGKGEAELLDMRGESAAMGVRTASSTVYFRCGSEEPATVASATTAAGTKSLPDAYYERIEKVKAGVLSGDIVATKGIVSSNPSPSFKLMPSADVEMIEGRSIWWMDNGNWYIHVPNVSASNVEAFELTITPGSCKDAAAATKQVVVIQLARPVEAGSDGLVAIPAPTPSKEMFCSVTTRAWTR